MVPTYEEYFVEEEYGAKRKNVYACVEWCEQTPRCGGFTYFPTAVKDTPEQSCLLKKIPASGYSYTDDSTHANEDTISGSTNCFLGGKLYHTPLYHATALL